MIMPTLMVLLVWLVAGATLLVWWAVADRVFDAWGEARRIAAARREKAHQTDVPPHQGFRV